MDYDPVSIDAFLRDNNSLEKAGKIMIIYSLLKKEDRSFFGMREKSDNWYSLLFNDILSGCVKPDDISKNKLNIITFNYDLSLECALHQKIKNTEFLKENDVCNNYITELESKIKHVYGGLYSKDILAES